MLRGESAGVARSIPPAAGPRSPGAGVPIADEPGWPNPALAWTALVLLMAGAVVSQLDRQIISLVVEPLKAEFGLTDTQYGMLQSVAFGLFYTSMTLPIGVLADRYQRRAVIGGGVALFSLFSMSTGLAGNFVQLFLARVGVGVGEASVYPAGFSIIADYFPPRRLARAISLFTASSMIGSGLAFAGGGALIGWLTDLHAQHPHLLFGLEPWRLALIAVALPGAVIAPCFFLLREPVRRGLAAGSAKPPFRLVLAEIWTLRRFLALMLPGFAMVTTLSYSLGVWAPALFIRVYHWTPAQIGLALGALYLTCATTGGYAAGAIVDRLRARGMVDAPLKVAAYSFIGCAVTGGLAPLAPTAELSLLLLAPTLFLQAMPYACAPTALQLIVPNQFRSQVSAVYLTFINLIGLGVGPLIVGLFTDYVFRRPEDVGYSLAIVVACSAPIMTVLVLLSGRPYLSLALAAKANSQA